MCECVRPLSGHYQRIKVLDKQEATALLNTIDPVSHDYQTLFQVIIRGQGIIELGSSHQPYKVQLSQCKLRGGFGSSEHLTIGEEIQLEGLPKGSSLLVKDFVCIHFHHIVALAGDFYGVYRGAISLPGGTEEEKESRFIKAFETLEHASPYELRNIIREIESEVAIVKHSGLPHHCYSNLLIEKNNTLKSIKGDVDKLLIDNSDHFSSNAEEAYLVGHKLAMKQAREAGLEKDLAKLKKAYAIESFACHFLTDLFAAGHTRNQRGALEDILVSKLRIDRELAKKYAGLLTGAQHEKDGNEGLNVCNKRGAYWRAYGDGHFFSPKNKENKNKVVEATQESVNEVYQAYMCPDEAKETKMKELIPHQTNLNPHPLYEVKDGNLFFYINGKKEQISEKKHYITKGLPLALQHLPESYIHGFIDGYIKPADTEVAPFLKQLSEKIILPRLERITNGVWHIAGIATYCQVKKEFLQLNNQMKELASTAKSMYDNTVQILGNIEKIKKCLESLNWESKLKEVREAVQTVKDKAHEYQLFHDNLFEEQKRATAHVLWGAYIRLSRVFSDNQMTNDYKKMLGLKGGLSEEMIHFEVALWFRQIIDYQIIAVSLYAVHSINTEADADLLPSQLAKSERSLMDQIKANKDVVSEDLVNTSQQYITLQIEKTKIIEQIHAYLKLDRSK